MELAVKFAYLFTLSLQHTSGALSLSNSRNRGASADAALPEYKAEVETDYQ